MKSLYNYFTVLICFCLLPTFSFAQPGSLDLTFGSNGKVTTAIGSADDNGYSVAIQSDGKIVVAGYSYNGANNDFALVRYNSNGSLDNTFGSGGKVTTAIGSAADVGNSVVIQSDGKILVAGYSYNGTNNDFALVRYNSNGSLDNTFGSGGKVTTDFGSSGDVGNSVTIQTDGKIVVAGYSNNGSNNDFALARYNSNGSLDNTFGTGGKVTTDFGGYDSGFSVAIQSDGKIIVVGNFEPGSQSLFALARYNSDGSLDNTFGIGGKVTTAIIGSGNGSDAGLSVAVQGDGKIVVAGRSIYISNASLFALIRYNGNGSLDNTFGTGGIDTTHTSSSLDYGFTVAIQSDGKIVEAGYSSIGSYYDFSLIRYNSNGSLDNTFGSGGKVTTPIGSTDDEAYSVALQSDGKIVVAGLSYNGANNDFAVVRYNITPAPTVSSITFTNNIQNHPGITPLFTLYTGSAYATNNPIKICADGSTATYFKVNVSSTAGISFRVLDELGNPISDVAKYGQLGTPNIFGNNVEVAYTHPQYMDASAFFRQLTLQVLYNGTPISGIAFPLNIYRAPVLMVHGLWGDYASFEIMDNWLEGSIYYPAALTRRADYHETNAANFSTNIMVTPNSIRDIFLQIRNYNFSAGKVDIVAHSMGGILSRGYLQNANYKNDIHKLITINTPHSGTQSANFLRSSAIGANAAVNFLALKHNFVDLGAVDDLKVGSNAILIDLNGAGNLNNHIVPCHSIMTDDIYSLATDEGKLIRIISLARLESPTSFLLTLFGGSPNDLIVPTESQKGGLTDFSYENNISHTNAEKDPSVYNDVVTLLNESITGVHFDGNVSGYNPPILSSSFSIDNPPRENSTFLSGTVNIISPPQYSTYNVGDIVPITITTTNVNKMICSAGNEDIDITFVDTIGGNITWNYSVPSNAIGQVKAIVFGFDTTAGFVASDTLILNINVPATLDSIHFYPEMLYTSVGGHVAVELTGFYSDSISRSISYLPNIQYQIADTSIAEYLTSNIIEGRQVGLTTLRVIYQSDTVFIPVQVFEADTTLTTGINGLYDFMNGNNNHLLIYPNPAKNDITLAILNSSFGNGLLNIYNSVGGKIYSEKIKNSSRDFIKHIHLDIPNGIYFVQVSDETKTCNQKLIIQ